MPQTPFKNVLQLLSSLGAAVNGSGAEANAQLDATLSALRDFLATAQTAAGQSGAAARKTLADKYDFEQGVQLEQFFTDVASSLITAQVQLDAASLAYSRDAALLNLPPARYAIPNVKAQLRFGVSGVTSKGLNLLLFSDSKQKEEYSESSIEFDLVAASPEPKSARLAGLPVAVATGERRDAVLDKFLALVPTTLGTQDKVDQRLQANRDLAAVFEYAQTAKPRFLIFWPGRSPVARASVLKWRFFVAAVLEGDALLATPFEVPANLIANVLYIPNDNDLDAQPGEAKALTWNLGDLLLQLCFLCAGQPVPDK